MNWFEMYSGIWYSRALVRKTDRYIYLFFDCVKKANGREKFTLDALLALAED